MYYQLNKENLSHQIAQTIEEMILGQEIQIGERLPGEIDLANRFGASRNVVREALTMLRERGLVNIRSGSGTFVTQVHPQILGEVVTRMAVIGSVSVNEIFEIRMALEVRACGLAALNGTPEEKAKLQSIVENMKNNYRQPDKWNEYDRKFHSHLSKMTNNSLFPAMIIPLISLIFPNSETNHASFSEEAIWRGLEQHNGILKTVLDGDRKLAEDAIATHLQTYLEDIISFS